MAKAGNMGWKAGVANYSHDELHSLMGMILDRLPISGDDWDLIVNDHAKICFLALLFDHNKGKQRLLF